MPPKKILGNFKNVHQTFASRNRAAKSQLPEPGNDTPKHGIEYSDDESDRPKRLRRDSSLSDEGFGGFGGLGGLSDEEILDLGADEIPDMQASVSLSS